MIELPITGFGPTIETTTNGVDFIPINDLPTTVPAASHDIGRIVTNYGYAEKSEVSEIQRGFAKAVVEVVVAKFKDAPHINLLDASANDLNVTLAFCEGISEAAKMIGKGVSQIKIWANDLSYKDKFGAETDLAKRAQQARIDSGDNGKVIQRSLIAKEADAIAKEDVDGQELDVVWDRLGAMWHTLGGRDLNKVKHLLERYREMLKDGGILILDGSAPGSGVGFDTDSKLRRLLDDANLDDGWFTQLGFTTTRERKNNQKLLVLKRV